MTGTIFVVDDEPVIANILAAMLSRAGFRTSTFTNLAQAIEASKLAIPQMLILDAYGTGLYVHESALLFRQCCPDCKVLLFAGRSCAADLLSEESLPVDDTHVKFVKSHPADFLVKAGLRHDVECSTESLAQGELQFNPHSLWMSKTNVAIQNQSERL